MAESPIAEKAVEPQQAKPGGSKKLIFIIGGAVVALGAVFAILVVLGVVSFGHKAAVETEEAQAIPTDSKAPLVRRPTVGLKEFVVNLADTDQTRYLKANIEIEVTGPAIAAACDANQASIRNSLVELLSSKTIAEIRDIKGKAKLRQEIIVRLNEIIGTNGVTQVFITDFIIQ